MGSHTCQEEEADVEGESEGEAGSQGPTEGRGAPGAARPPDGRREGLGPHGGHGPRPPAGGLAAARTSPRAASSPSGRTAGRPQPSRSCGERLRKSYEFLSRTKSWPLIGNTLFNLLDRIQNIPRFYPIRDMSSPSDPGELPQGDDPEGPLPGACSTRSGGSRSPSSAPSMRRRSPPTWPASPGTTA